MKKQNRTGTYMMELNGKLRRSTQRVFELRDRMEKARTSPTKAQTLPVIQYHLEQAEQQLTEIRREAIIVVALIEAFYMVEPPTRADKGRFYNHTAKAVQV